ncbi:hypothetical protein E4U43_002849 [Claviceps pusilla]|uniref:Nitrogen regulatory protein areA GATA-like domain-containing protein n=1 Tax=Claviceps pusilla TaxID=123648 RepID=A0A9P7N601_9HYPO|nr:hypothetical protein E4U43_002849 [Claviceps pusilla]
MPYRLDTHVLTVDANVIHKVDTTNPANLYSMWTVFSRCADSVEQGRRLENLSWRVWQREQLVESSKQSAISSDAAALTLPSSNTSSSATTLPQNVHAAESRIQEVPLLSGSVDSLADEEAVEFTSVSAPLEIRPRIHRLDSSNSRRDRHISSDDFEKLVVSIVKDRAPLSAPSQTLPHMAAVNRVEVADSALAVSTSPTLTRLQSTTTATATATIESQPSEVKCEISHPCPLPKTIENQQVRAPTFPEATAAASSQHPLPEPSSSPAVQHVQPKKQRARFALGGSCSSGEQSQSIENPKVRSVMPARKPLFQVGDSSGEDSNKSSVHSIPAAAAPTAAAKTTALAAPPIAASTAAVRPPQHAQIAQINHLAAQASRHSESAIDSDTEAEYVDESAIDDDDDSSDWEDSVEDSGKSSVDDKFFQRVESKANLTSRPSLITLMLAQNERARALGSQNYTSQSTPAIQRMRRAPSNSGMGVSPNDSDEGPLMMKGMRPSVLNPISEIPRSSAQPIMATAAPIPFQAALSPRTTRRNMLATELTESLRRHLLWERQQKTMTAKAALKRRHTAHDVANLKQFPDKACMKASEDVEARSWNQNFCRETMNGYHSKGW